MPPIVAEYQAPSTHFLLNHGPHVPVSVGGRGTVALLDSGSRYSYVDMDFAADLGAGREGRHTARGATGTDTYPAFNVSFHIPLLSMSLEPPIRGLPLREQEHFWRVIVGRDILKDYELTIDWRSGRIRLVGP